MQCRSIVRSSRSLSRLLSRLPALLLLSLVFLSWQPARARADSAVVVLGVRSLDGEDEFARDVSRALRENAKQVKTWRVSDRDISLAQMSLAHGCEEPDARCMADIASTLEVDRLVYGTMVHRASTIDIALFNFDAVTGQVETSLNERVAESALTGEALKVTTGGFARRLGGIDVTGALRVRSDAAGARVSLDGKPVGVLDGRGELLLAGLSVGTHTLLVAKQDERSEQHVQIKEAETTTAQVTLNVTGAISPVPDADASAEDEASGGKIPRRRIFGYSAVGLAGVMAAATLYSWVRIDRINKDADLRAYRDQFGPNDDVCTEAEAGTLAATMGKLEASARSLCKEADALEVLQYVFLGGTLVAGGIGAYLLLSDRAPDEPMSVTLQPRFARGRGQLSATLRF